MQMSYFSPHLSCWQENRFTLPWQLWGWTWEIHKCWSRKNKNGWNRGGGAGISIVPPLQDSSGFNAFQMRFVWAGLCRKHGWSFLGWLGPESSQTFLVLTIIWAFHELLIAPGRATDPPETMTSVLIAKDDQVAKLRIIRRDMKPPVKYIPDVLNVVNKM